MVVIEVSRLYHAAVLRYLKTGSNATLYSISHESDYTSIVYPHIGTYQYVYKNNTFTIEYCEEGAPISCNGDPGYFMRMRISLEGDDIIPLKEFITDAFMNDKNTQEINQVKIFTSTSRGYFASGGSIYAQTFEHMFLPESIKKDVRSSVDRFLTSKDRYKKFGRLYKTAFLLTGPPGCGKTSLVKAVALEYKRPIYILNFTKGLTDENFIDLMTELKEDAILLIEDIDAFFIDRTAVDINISFSAFINFLDGTLGRGNGVITFITANNPDHLDPAMIRPGRVDKIIKFEGPKRREIEQAFNALTDDPSGSKFADFYSHIAKTAISMSGIVDYLFRNPDTYIENIAQLIQQAKLLDEIVSDNTDKLYS
jgi:energy-coupling factor transporter ATP-binding protein EcfA2